MLSLAMFVTTGSLELSRRESCVTAANSSRSNQLSTDSPTSIDTVSSLPTSLPSQAAETAIGKRELRLFMLLVPYIKFDLT